MPNNEEVATVTRRKVLVEVAGKADMPQSEEYANVAERALEGITGIDLEAVLVELKSIVASVVETFTPREGGPAGCEVTFGVKINAEGNVILAKIGSEVNLEIKLSWARPTAS
jgi:hypothetical protein